MKFWWIWPVLISGIIGVAIGFAIGGHFAARQVAAASAILDDLVFSEFIPETGSSAWKIVEDKVYDSFPPLSRSPRIARRIVAHASLSDSEQGEFAARFQNAANQWITSHGAVIKGQQDANQTSAEALADGRRLLMIDLPRRYYATGDINGVADFWCLADSGRVTVIISIIEGP